MNFSRLFGRFPLIRGSSYFGAQHDFKPGCRWSPQPLIAPKRQLNCYPQFFHQPVFLDVVVVDVTVVVVEVDG